ncbi:hypothetical protein AB5I41_28965 [Sphingomonas sp. MMS24-JH45]
MSALATVAATAAALFLPWRQRKLDMRERQQALGYALFLKMVKVSSDLFKLHQHVVEQRQNAISHGAHKLLALLSSSGNTAGSSFIRNR